MTSKKGRRRAVTVLGARLKVRGNKRYYTIRELMKLTGLTRRQIDYWASAKLIAPTLRNTSVRGARPASFYSASEALKVLIFSDVKQRGFSLGQIRQLHRNFASNGVRLDEAGIILTDGWRNHTVRPQRKRSDRHS